MANKKYTPRREKPLYLLVYTGRGDESCLCKGVVIREPNKRNKTFKVMIVSVNRSTIYGNLEPNEPLLKKIVGLKVNRKKEQLHNNVPPWIEKKLSPQWMSMKETTITQKIRTRRC